MLALSTSCKNGDDDDAGPDAGFGTLTATVAGSTWVSKDEVDGAVFVSSQGTNTIQAYATDDSYISLTFFGSLISGLTLTSDDGSFQGNYKPDFFGDESFIGLGSLGSGTATITNFSDSNISGNFQFTGGKANPDGSVEQVVINGGSFNIDY